MGSGEKKYLVILIIVAIVIMGIVYIATRPKNTEELGNEQKVANNTEIQNGDKTAQSDKLKQKKEINGLEVTDIAITEKNGTAELRANVTNTTSSQKAEFTVKIKMLDKNGNVIQELGALIGKTKPGETRQIMASVDMDISEVQDIAIEK